MNQKVKQYLESQEKVYQKFEAFRRSKILIEANLCESYMGPHVEELFDPLPNQQIINKTDTLQFVTERATGKLLGIRYNFKEQAFEVLTPLEVTDEEFAQIEKYAKLKPKVRSTSDLVIMICATLFYLLSFVLILFRFSNEQGDLTLLALAAGLIGTGFVCYELYALIKKQQ